MHRWFFWGRGTGRDFKALGCSTAWRAGKGEMYQRDRWHPLWLDYDIEQYWQPTGSDFIPPIDSWVHSLRLPASPCILSTAPHSALKWQCAACKENKGLLVWTGSSSVVLNRGIWRDVGEPERKREQMHLIGHTLVPSLFPSRRCRFRPSVNQM